MTATLLLSSCGTSSLTIKVPSSGSTVVVSSDGDAINALKTKVQQSFASSGDSVVDGDQHSGNHICGFGKTKNSHSYQVDVYGGAPTDSCNATAQQQFLNQVP